MGVFSEEENPWNGGQFESDFQAWEYFIVGSGLPGGGGCNVFLTFYAISNISRKKSGNTK